MAFLAVKGTRDAHSSEEIRRLINVMLFNSRYQASGPYSEATSASLCDSAWLGHVSREASAQDSFMLSYRPSERVLGLQKGIVLRTLSFSAMFRFPSAQCLPCLTWTARRSLLARRTAPDAGGMMPTSCCPPRASSCKENGYIVRRLWISSTLCAFATSAAPCASVAVADVAQRLRRGSRQRPPAWPSRLQSME